MNESQLKELINRCLSGEASQEEQMMLQKWYESFDVNQGLTPQLNEEQKAEMADRMLSGIHISIGTIHEGKGKRSFSISYTFIRVAASVIIIGMCWFFYRYIKSSNAEPQQPVQWAEFSGIDGQVSTHTLPDSSVVKLNGSGRIRYMKNFVQTSREVWLEGEGYFDVVRQPEHPFKVHSNNIMASVLGTAFNMKTSGQDSQIVVTVTDGRVSVQNNKKILGVLGVNDQLYYNNRTGEYKQIKVYAASIVAWAGGSLVFKEIPFKEIAAVLEQRFNVRIQFSNTGLQHCILTASFDENVQANDILEMLCKINGSRLMANKDSFTISGKPCKK